MSYAFLISTFFTAGFAYANTTVNVTCRYQIPNLRGEIEKIVSYATPLDLNSPTASVSEIAPAAVTEVLSEPNNEQGHIVVHQKLTMEQPSGNAKKVRLGLNVEMHLVREKCFDSQWSPKDREELCRPQWAQVFYAPVTATHFEDKELVVVSSAENPFVPSFYCAAAGR